VKFYLSFVVAGFFTFSSVVAFAEEGKFGLVADLSGEASVLVKGKGEKPVEVGMELGSGDVIRLKGKAGMTILSFADCREWDLSGLKDAVVIDTKRGLLLKDSEIKPTRTAKTCSKPEDFKGLEPTKQGGITLRGVQKKSE
jgi:hypothetical protein